MKYILTLSMLLMNSILVFAKSDTLYFKEDSLKAVGSYDNGRENGKWTYFFWSNEKQSEGFFKNAVLTGKWTNWYINGQKYLEGSYEEGQKQGIWITWDSLGTKIREEEFEKGQRIGILKEWNHSKGEATISHWKNDKLNGTTEWRNITDGTLLLTIEYKDGKKDGMLTFYFPNGKVKSKGMYKNDKEEGEHIWYNEDGTIQATAIYKNGEVVN